MAFGAGVYLSAWVDYRVESGNRAGDVFVARWSDSGELLDPAGIAVGMAPEAEIKPAVSFDGRNFLVAWHRYIFSPGEGHTQIRAARVSPEGAILDAAPFVIEADGSAHGIAFDDSQWFAVAMVGWPDYQLSFTPIDENGALGARWLQGFPTDGDLYGMAGGAGALLVVGGDLSAFPVGRNWARLVDTASQAVQEGDLGPAGDASAGRSGRAAVTWSGEAFYSAWGGEAEQSLQLERITVAGERTPASIVAAGGIVVGVGGLAASRDAALLLHKQVESSAYGLRAHLLTLPSMQPVRDIVLDPNLEHGGNSDTARGTTSFGTIWDSTADGRVRWGLVADGAEVPAPALLAPAGPIAQRGPAVAADDLGFSLAWCEESTEGSRVWLLRFDASGAARDPSPIDLGSGCGQSVARRDGQTLVAWADGGGSGTASITDQESSPTVSLTPPVPNRFGSVPTSSVPSVVAAAVDGFAIAYIEGPDDTRTLFFSIGSVPSGATWLSQATIRRAGVQPALAGTSDGVAVAYITFDSETVGGPLVLELASATAMRALEMVPSGAWHPALAYAEGRLLVAWREGARDGLKRIRIALVDEARWAVVSGPIDVSATGANGDRPVVAYDGAEFVVGWRESLDGRGDLYLARVSLDGQLLDGASIALTNNGEPELDLELASSPEGKVLCAYTQLDTTISAARSRMRWLSARAP